MEILNILEAMEEIINNSASVPLSGKCLIDRDDLLDFIAELKDKIPDDIKQAKWVKEERERILKEAQNEASKLIEDAEKRITALINDHEITKKAYEQANQVIAESQKHSKEIRLSSMEYADNLLSDIEKTLKKTLKVIEENRSQLR